MKRNALLIFPLLLALLFCSCAPKTAPTLCDAKANETALKVYRYLCETEGTATLSAQQESTWMESPEFEMDYIYGSSGKLPAVRGLDYMNDDFDGVNERALRWWKQGGLVTICWHTGADFSGAWDEAMNDEIPDWDRALTEGTDEYNALLAGMDKAAAALSKLQDEGVCVLWRPFHEFDGAWFWWGKGGPENFKKLWKLMYTRYTEHWGLHNLIWVLGFSHNGEKIKPWYPGDEYCDIIGADSYDGGAQPELYKAVRKIHAGDKPLCFHECGANPTAEELGKTRWLWFMTWHTEYLTDNNTPEALNALYNSDNIITRDELPAF